MGGETFLFNDSHGLTQLLSVPGGIALVASGEIMVAIWWGTQADEVFPEAWQSDTGGHAMFRSKTYLSPKLWYLRVNVIEAQDLGGMDKGRVPDPVCQCHVQ